MDDIQPQIAKPISDDQELAKVLAGVSQESNNLGFEETPTSPAVAGSEANSAPKMPQLPVDDPANIIPPSSNDDDLDSIKKDALTELRPLVDKLDLEPEEKFDTYLLLLRSTDDKTLIPQAHAAARNISDETRRAQALLDIIKEIDYLSAPTQPII